MMGTIDSDWIIKLSMDLKELNRLVAGADYEELKGDLCEKAYELEESHPLRVEFEGIVKKYASRGKVPF